jgi:SDR family mycofactocin-dependent oxidoreductase
MGRVDGKVVFITGAARGQGRSHAVRLAEEGADLIAVDICRDIEANPYSLSRPDDLKETVRLVEALGRRIVAVEADVREPGQLRCALDQGLTQFGKLDIVVANAGIAPFDATAGRQGWLDVIGVNLMGAQNAIHVALPHLQAGASIIAIGSVAAFMPNESVQNPGANPGAAGYTVAKRALSNYIHELARTMAPEMIRVNIVHPTNCDTDMLHSDAMYHVFRPDLASPTRADAVVAFPAQQAMPVPWVEPVDISHAVVYLASDESRYVTGMQMRVDAGSYLKFHAFHT